MKINNIIIVSTFTIYLIIALLNLNANAVVVITGKNAGIDLTDILYPGRMLSNEIEIRKICVEITERYHSRGYTAFRIKSTVLKKEGSVELFFGDPLISRITVTGADPYNDTIAGEIHGVDEAFNETDLNRNISYIKKKYSIKKLKVDLKRNADDNIDLYVSAEKKLFGSSITAESDPVYGGLTSISLVFLIPENMFYFNFATSAGMREASYTESGIGYLLNSLWGNSVSFKLFMQYKEKRMYIDQPEEGTYKEKIIRGESGFILNKGAAQISFTAVSTCGEYNFNKESGKDYFFPGISVLFRYNDAYYRIDPFDVSTAEVKSECLRNPAEKKIDLRINIKGYSTIPLSEICSLSACVNSDYTTENEIIFQDYVFNRTLPLRENDYTTAKWKHTLYPGFLFDLYNRFIFLSPVYIISVYEKCGRKDSVHGFSFKSVVTSEFFSSEIAYTIEAGKPLKEGVFTFKADAKF